MYIPARTYKPPLTERIVFAIKLVLVTTFLIAVSLLLGMPR